MINEGESHKKQRLMQTPYTGAEAVSKLLKNFGQLSDAVSRFGLTLNSIHIAAENIEHEFRNLASMISMSRHSFSSTSPMYGAGARKQHFPSPQERLIEFEIVERSKNQIRDRIKSERGEEPYKNTMERLEEYETFLEEKEKLYRAHKDKMDSLYTTDKKTPLTTDEKLTDYQTFLDGKYKKLKAYLTKEADLFKIMNNVKAMNRVATQKLVIEYEQQIKLQKKNKPNSGPGSNADTDYISKEPIYSETPKAGKGKASVVVLDLETGGAPNTDLRKNRNEYIKNADILQIAAEFRDEVGNVLDTFNVFLDKRSNDIIFPSHKDSNNKDKFEEFKNDWDAAGAAGTRVGNDPASLQAAADKLAKMIADRVVPGVTKVVVKDNFDAGVIHNNQSEKNKFFQEHLAPVMQNSDMIDIQEVFKELFAQQKLRSPDNQSELQRKMAEIDATGGTTDYEKPIFTIEVMFKALEKELKELSNNLNENADDLGRFHNAMGDVRIEALLYLYAQRKLKQIADQNAAEAKPKPTKPAKPAASSGAETASKKPRSSGAPSSGVQQVEIVAPLPLPVKIVGGNLGGGGGGYSGGDGGGTPVNFTMPGFSLDEWMKRHEELVAKEDEAARSNMGKPGSKSQRDIVSEVLAGKESTPQKYGGELDAESKLKRTSNEDWINNLVASNKISTTEPAKTVDPNQPLVVDPIKEQKNTAPADSASNKNTSNKFIDAMKEDDQKTFEIFQKNNPNLLEKIKDLHADKKTAGQISQITGQDEEVIRSLRRSMNLPSFTGGFAKGTLEFSQEDVDKFETWKADYLKSKSGNLSNLTTPPSAVTTTPQPSVITPPAPAALATPEQLEKDSELHKKTIKRYGFQTLKDLLSGIKKELPGDENGNLIYTPEQKYQTQNLEAEIQRRENFKPGIPGTVSKDVNGDTVYIGKEGEAYPYSEKEGIDTRFSRSTSNVDPDIAIKPDTVPIDRNPYKPKEETLPPEQKAPLSKIEKMRAAQKDVATPQPLPPAPKVKPEPVAKPNLEEGYYDRKHGIEFGWEKQAPSFDTNFKEAIPYQNLITNSIQELLASFQDLMLPVLSKAKLDTTVERPGAEGTAAFDTLSESAQNLVSNFQKMFGLDLTKISNFSASVFGPDATKKNKSDQNFAQGLFNRQSSSIKILQSENETGDVKDNSFGTLLHESIHAMFNQLRKQTKIPQLGKIENINFDEITKGNKEELVAIQEMYKKLVDSAKAAFIEALAVQNYGSLSKNNLEKAAEDLEGMEYFKEPEEIIATLIGDTFKGKNKQKGYFARKNRGWESRKGKRKPNEVENSSTFSKGFNAVKNFFGFGKSTEQAEMADEREQTDQTDFTQMSLPRDKGKTPQVTRQAKPKPGLLKKSINSFSRIKDGLKKNTLLLAKKSFNYLAGKSKSGLGAFFNPQQENAKVLAQFITPIVTGVATSLGGLAAGLDPLTAASSGGIAAAGTALLAQTKTISKPITFVTEKVAKTFASKKEKLFEGMKVVREIGKDILTQGITGPAKEAMRLVSEIGNDLKAGIFKTGKGIKTTGKGTVTLGGKVGNKTGSFIKKGIKSAFNLGINLISGVGSGIKDTSEIFYSGIKDDIKKSPLAKAAKFFIGGTLGGVKDSSGIVIKGIKEDISNIFGGLKKLGGKGLGVAQKNFSKISGTMIGGALGSLPGLISGDMAGAGTGGSLGAIMGGGVGAMFPNLLTDLVNMPKMLGTKAKAFVQNNLNTKKKGGIFSQMWAPKTVKRPKVSIQGTTPAEDTFQNEQGPVEAPQTADSYFTGLDNARIAQEEAERKKAEEDKINQKHREMEEEENNRRRNKYNNQRFNELRTEDADSALYDDKVGRSSSTYNANLAKPASTLDNKDSGALNRDVSTASYEQLEADLERIGDLLEGPAKSNPLFVKLAKVQQTKINDQLNRLDAIKKGIYGPFQTPEKENEVYKEMEFRREYAKTSQPNPHPPQAPERKPDEAKYAAHLAQIKKTHGLAEEEPKKEEPVAEKALKTKPELPAKRERGENISLMEALSQSFDRLTGKAYKKGYDPHETFDNRADGISSVISGAKDKASSLLDNFSGVPDILKNALNSEIKIPFLPKEQTEEERLNGSKTFSYSGFTTGGKTGKTIETQGEITANSWQEAVQKLNEQGTIFVEKISEINGGIEGFIRNSLRPDAAVSGQNNQTMQYLEFLKDKMKTNEMVNSNTDGSLTEQGVLESNKLLQEIINVLISVRGEPQAPTERVKTDQEFDLTEAAFNRERSEIAGDIISGGNANKDTANADLSFIDPKSLPTQAADLGVNDPNAPYFNLPFPNQPNIPFKQNNEGELITPNPTEPIRPSFSPLDLGAVLNPKENTNSPTPDQGSKDVNVSGSVPLDVNVLNIGELSKGAEPASNTERPARSTDKGPGYLAKGGVIGKGVNKFIANSFGTEDDEGPKGKDKIRAYLATGEAVLPEEAVKNNKNLVSDLLKNKKIKYMKKGGMVGGGSIPRSSSGSGSAPAFDSRVLAPKGDIFGPIKQWVGDFSNNTRLGFIGKSVMDFGKALQGTLNGLAGFVKAASPDAFSTLTGSIQLLIGSIGVQFIPIILRVSAILQGWYQEILSGEGVVGGLIAKFAEWVNGMPEDLLENLVGIGLVVAGITALAPVFAGLMAVVGIVGAGFSLLLTALGMIASGFVSFVSFLVTVFGGIATAVGVGVAPLAILATGVLALVEIFGWATGSFRGPITRLGEVIGNFCVGVARKLGILGKDHSQRNDRSGAAERDEAKKIAQSFDSPVQAKEALMKEVEKETENIKDLEKEAAEGRKNPSKITRTKTVGTGSNLRQVKMTADDLDAEVDAARRRKNAFETQGVIEQQKIDKMEKDKPKDGKEESKEDKAKKLKEIQDKADALLNAPKPGEGGILGMQLPDMSSITTGFDALGTKLKDGLAGMLSSGATGKGKDEDYDRGVGLDKGLEKGKINENEYKKQVEAQNRRLARIGTDKEEKDDKDNSIKFGRYADKYKVQKETEEKQKSEGNKKALLMSFQNSKSQSSFSAVEEAYKKIQVSALGDDPMTAEMKKLNEVSMVNLLKALQQQQAGDKKNAEMIAAGNGLAK